MTTSGKHSSEAEEIRSPDLQGPVTCGKGDEAFGEAKTWWLGVTGSGSRDDDLQKEDAARRSDC
jgi:hypothetical protein